MGGHASTLPWRWVRAARGVVAASLEVAARKIGLTGRVLRKLVRDSGKEAAHCSRWIYLLSRKSEWERREV